MFPSTLLNRVKTQTNHDNNITKNNKLAITNSSTKTKKFVRPKPCPKSEATTNFESPLPITYVLTFKREFLILYNNHVYYKSHQSVKNPNLMTYRCRGTMASFESDLRKRCGSSIQIDNAKRVIISHTNYWPIKHLLHRDTYDPTLYIGVMARYQLQTIISSHRYPTTRDAFNALMNQFTSVALISSIKNYNQFKSSMWRYDHINKPSLPRSPSNLNIFNTFFEYNLYGKPHSQKPELKQKMYYQSKRDPLIHIFMTYAQATMCNNCHLIMSDGTMKTTPKILNHKFPWPQVFTINVCYQTSNLGHCERFFGYVIYMHFA